MLEKEIEKLGKYPYIIYMKPSKKKTVRPLDYSNVFGLDTEFVDYSGLTEKEEIELKELKNAIKDYKIPRNERLYVLLKLREQGLYDINMDRYMNELLVLAKLRKEKGKVTKVDYESTIGKTNYTRCRKYEKMLERYDYLLRKKYSSARKVLSFQIAWKKEQEVKSGVIYVNSEYIDIADICKEIDRIRREEFEKSKMPNTVYLIAHFSQAELSTIRQFSPNYIYREDTKVIEISQTYMGEVKYNKTTFKFLDTFAFFKSSLESLGDMISYEKIKVDKEDKERMDLLLQRDRKLYEKYATRDAEITLLIFERMYDMGRQRGVNIFDTPSAPSFFMDIFRRNYLYASPVPITRRGYRTRMRLDKRIRQLALLAYHGGRNEAYWVGKLFKPVYYYDVKSCYPVAAQLIPLPMGSTKWLDFSSIKETEGMEGFARVTFEFPEGERYPCLPVQTEEYLLYPRKGVSYATLAEVRLALDMGAKIKKTDGWGYKPTEVEINNPLKKYMKDFFETRMNVTSKFEKDYYKLGMNSLIGKFAQRVSKYDLIEMARELEVPIEALKYMIMGNMKDNHKSISLGSGFSPEWATLVLGKARAIISDIIRSNQTYMAITDSVMIKNRVPKECAALEEIRLVGSFLELKGCGDTAIVFRDRAYYIFQNGEISSDDNGHKLKAVGGLGVRVNDTEFDKEIKKHVFENGDLPEKVIRRRLTRFREAYKTGYKWNFDTYEKVTPAYTYWKRFPMLGYEKRYTTNTRPFRDIIEFYEYYKGGVKIDRVMKEKNKYLESDY